MGDTDTLAEARKALAEYDAPRCGKRIGVGPFALCELREGHHFQCSFLPLDSRNPVFAVPHLRTTLARVTELEAEVVRLRDLARHQRGPLHDAGLITDAEYATLAADHEAVARLEGYDEMRAEVARLRRVEEAAREYVRRRDRAFTVKGVGLRRSGQLDAYADLHAALGDKP